MVKVTLTEHDVPAEVTGGPFRGTLDFNAVPSVGDNVTLAVRGEEPANFEVTHVVWSQGEGEPNELTKPFSPVVHIKLVQASGKGAAFL